MSENRYVVSIRMEGLGDRLICLCAAWRFARNTRRKLMADWRHSLYSSSASANLFSQCFQPPRDIAGVSFIGDDTVGRIRLPRPRYPSIWNNELLRQLPSIRPKKTLFQDREKAVKLIRSGTDITAPTVIFDAMY
jgi:hypothetical protein